MGTNDETCGERYSKDHPWTCDLPAGHLGRHGAPEGDGLSRVAWIGGRCASVYPGAATLNGKAIRCGREAGHDGQHAHTFAARYWTTRD